MHKPCFDKRAERFVKLFVTRKLNAICRGRRPRRPFEKCHIHFTSNCRGGALSPPVTCLIYQRREDVEALPYNIVFTLIYLHTFWVVEDADPYYLVSPKTSQ